jgi:hypothetical protein
MVADSSVIGGTLELREREHIPGDPKEFLGAAEAALGHPVQMLFRGDDQSALRGPPDKVTVIRDEQGKPAFSVSLILCVASSGRDRLYQSDPQKHCKFAHW